MIVGQQAPVVLSTPLLGALNKPAAPDSHSDKFQQGDPNQPDPVKRSWLDLTKGVGGALLGGAAEGVGMGASSVLRGPQLATHALKGVWKSAMLGPFLKTALSLEIVALGVASPIVGALGGVINGAREGFKEGVAKGPLAALPAAGRSISEFHHELSDKATQAISELSAQRPQDGKVYEVTPFNFPRAYVGTTKKIWDSDLAMPLKMASQFLVSSTCVMALPPLAVAGVLHASTMGAAFSEKWKSTKSWDSTASPGV